MSLERQEGPLIVRASAFPLCEVRTYCQELSIAVTWADGRQTEFFHLCVESKLQRLTGGGREASEEATAMTQGRQDSDLGQGGSSGGGQRPTDPGHVLKAGPTGLPGQWHRGCERMRGVRKDSKTLS